MSTSERKQRLIQQINSIDNEETLEMIEQMLNFYLHVDGKDITDGLSAERLRELEQIMREPADKDTISEEEFNEIMARRQTRNQ